MKIVIKLLRSLQATANTHPQNDIVWQQSRKRAGNETADSQHSLLADNLQQAMETLGKQGIIDDEALGVGNPKPGFLRSPNLAECVVFGPSV